jgi:hypothetical protein
MREKELTQLKTLGAPGPAKIETYSMINGKCKKCNNTMGPCQERSICINILY